MKQYLCIGMILLIGIKQQAADINNHTLSHDVVVAKRTIDQALHDFKQEMRADLDRLIVSVSGLFRNLINDSFIEPKLDKEMATADQIIDFYQNFIIEIHLKEDDFIKPVKEDISLREQDIKEFIAKNQLSLDVIDGLLPFTYKLMEDSINTVLLSIKNDFNKLKDLIYSKGFRDNYIHRFREYEKILNEKESIIIKKLHDVVHLFQDRLEEFKIKRVILLLTQNEIVSQPGGGAASVAVERAPVTISMQDYSDRQMNLVVFNDVVEVNNLFDKDDIITSLENILLGVINNPIEISMLQALLENQLVLCTQLFWSDVTELTYIFSYIKNFYNPASEDKIKLKNVITQGIIAYENFKQGTIHTFQELINQIAKIINDAGLSHRNLFKLFEIYIAYDIVISKNYLCKKLSDDFMLFIPMHIKDSNTMIPQEFYQNLTDINYKNHIVFLSASLIEGRKQRQLELKNNVALGESLLEALNLWNEQIKRIAIDNQPFTNIVLMGHGGINVTAELAIKNKKTGLAEGSDFLKFLNFLNNNLRTKTLLIWSCSTGGKKNIDAYNLTDKFDNFNLEHLKYTIINIGALYSFVYGQRGFFYEDFEMKSSFQKRVNHEFHSTYTTQYERYFSAINERTPNYTKMIQSGLFLYSDDFIKFNYITLKFPHTSWFTPTEFDTNVMRLSQIDVSTKKGMLTIPKNIKIILLGANYIPGKLKLDNPNVVILPTNYHNQNYYFKSPIQIEPFLDKMNYFKSLNEPLNIIFEKFIVTAEIEWTNYCIFTKQKASDIGITDSSDEIVSGYAYLDNDIDAVVYIFDDNTKRLVQKTLDRHKYGYYIRGVKQFIIDSLPKALEEEFLTSLSSKITTKPKVGMEIVSVAGGGASAGGTSTLVDSNLVSKAKESIQDKAATKIQKAWKQKVARKKVSL